ncbi:MAG TPA: hypothetical protein VH143_10675 [Kofleriaceae bacterium]|nr:hypothetical protein [Kofleriaceae bacterium]
MIRALLLATVALAGCKQNAEGYSCWMGKACEDYATDLPLHEKACKAIAAEWEKHACPSDNVVGTCTTAAHQARIYYGGAQSAYTSDSASSACEHELHGTWTSAKP